MRTTNAERLRRHREKAAADRALDCERILRAARAHSAMVLADEDLLRVLVGERAAAAVSALGGWPALVGMSAELVAHHLGDEVAAVLIAAREIGLRGVADPRMPR